MNNSVQIVHTVNFRVNFVMFLPHNKEACSMLTGWFKTDFFTEKDRDLLTFPFLDMFSITEESFTKLRIHYIWIVEIWHFLLKILYCLKFLMHECFAHMYVCYPCVCLIPVEIRRGIIFPGTKLQLAIATVWVLRN